jgi:4a-hydroxytetrahydrobiopterin dehydratase
MKLTEQKCVACEGGTIPLNRIEADILLKQIPRWEVSSDAKMLSRNYTFKNFKEALKFVNKVGEVAESEGHHPNIHMTDYKKVRIDLTTFAIGGLSNNDFILAAKVDEPA